MAGIVHVQHVQHVHVRNVHCRDIHDYLGCAVLLCLVVCLTLLASSFLPSHLSLKRNICTVMYSANLSTDVVTVLEGSLGTHTHTSKQHTRSQVDQSQGDCKRFEVIMFGLASTTCTLVITTDSNIYTYINTQCTHLQFYTRGWIVVFVSKC